MRRIVALAACGLTLTGCLTTQSYTLTQPYSETDFSPYERSGQADLRGQAFLKTVGGDVKTCAGNKVYLMPATAYNAEILAHVPATFTNRDGRADRFTRIGICDADGKFEFDSVPATQWFVLTDVTWGVPNGDFVNQQGGMVLQRVRPETRANSTRANRGGPPIGSDRISADARPKRAPSRKCRLKDLAISKTQSSRWQKLADLDETASAQRAMAAKKRAVASVEQTPRSESFGTPISLRVTRDNGSAAEPFCSAGPALSVQTRNTFRICRPPGGMAPGAGNRPRGRGL